MDAGNGCRTGSNKCWRMVFCNWTCNCAWILCGVGYAEVTLAAGVVVVAAAGAFVGVLLAALEGAGAGLAVVALVAVVAVVFADADEAGAGTEVSVCVFFGAGWSSLSVSSRLIFLLD